MIREYIATFHSHFGAMRFQKAKLKEGNNAQLQQDDKGSSNSFHITNPDGEIEQVVEIVGKGYKICYSELD